MYQAFNQRSSKSEERFLASDLLVPCPVKISLQNHMVIPPFSREFLVGTYIYIIYIYLYIYLYIYINIYIYTYYLRSHLLDNVGSAPPNHPFQRPKDPPHPIQSIHPSAPADPPLHHRKPNHAWGNHERDDRWSGSRLSTNGRRPRKRYGNMSKTSVVVCLFSLKEKIGNTTSIAPLPEKNSQGWGWVKLCRQMFGFGSFCTTTFSRVEQEFNGIGIEIGRYPRTASAWQHPLIFV